MGPKQVVPQSGALFQQTLLEMVNVKHPLAYFTERDRSFHANVTK